MDDEGDFGGIIVIFEGLVVVQPHTLANYVNIFGEDDWIQLITNLLLSLQDTHIGIECHFLFLGGKGPFTLVVYNSCKLISFIILIEFDAFSILDNLL